MAWCLLKHRGSFACYLARFASLMFEMLRYGLEDNGLLFLKDFWQFYVCDISVDYFESLFVYLCV
jgi:hypothetical protein